MEETDRPRRAGRRAGRRRGQQPAGVPRAAVPQLPWREVDNEHPPMQPLSADQVEAIHEASLQVLENLGMEVMGEEALHTFAAGGADVAHARGAAGDGASGLVRLDRGLVAEALAATSGAVTLQPRNPARSIRLGGNRLNFGFVSGAPNVHDAVRGRRGGNMDDFRTLMKLAQYFNCIHLLGNQVAPPVELPPNSRHLDTYHAALTLTDKVISAVPIGAGRVRDLVEMVAISRGETLAELEARPGVIGNINVNSPRKLDEEMARGAMELARLNQVTVVTPFTLMGAMTPVTMGAALVQQNAEALLGITLTQLVRPGAPVVYGGFTSNVDMRTGSPTFGTPENATANLAGGQLARRYGLPYRTSACNASNAVDAQSTWETMMALWGAVMGHGNFIYHAAGWLEGGLVASFEKIVVDVEVLQHVMAMLTPIDTSPDALGVDAIAAVPPGGHFFGTAHTLERYRTAFHEPLLADWQNHENWEAAGGLDATRRATAVWQNALADYQEPAMPADRREALDAYVARRREAIGSGDP